jgi:hypothetical protein
MASILHLLNTRQEAGKPPPPTGINTGGVKENEVKIIAASAFTIFLAMASTALRFMARKRRDLKWQADDYWMLVSAVRMLFIMGDALTDKVEDYHQCRCCVLYRCHQIWIWVSYGISATRELGNILQGTYLGNTYVDIADHGRCRSSTPPLCSTVVLWRQ